MRVHWRPANRVALNSPMSWFVRPVSARSASTSPTAEANFMHHPQAITRDANLVRYQMNPTPNWGPGSRASAGSGTKRKRPQGEEGEE